ncbi:LPS translocon maturation chaperone LptM [Rhodoferax antarcticus]|uniref:LPS translocon maturation chaperone LptM n=1 Tax=Rhodoferax antarcticus TaxID=81479 RepID=UPI002225A0B9|nr:lipoprotein [Rhodoferax antarcticus]MCW2311787.1 putative small lipoprotein YifL [Rhodoferax antarcticus]
MLFNKILVWRLTLAGAIVIVAACGQTGALYLPTPPAGVHRASLPESLRPASLMKTPPTDAAKTPATPPAKTASQPQTAH